MTTNILLVAVGGCFGAIARYRISQWVTKRTKTTFPYGTLTVNLLGSLLLGMIIGSNSSTKLALLLGTGFMGAFTTFSTFKLENIQLRKKNDHGTFYFYLGVSYVVGIFLAFIGLWVGSTWKG